MDVCANSFIYYNYIRQSSGNLSCFNFPIRIFEDSLSEYMTSFFTCLRAPEKGGGEAHPLPPLVTTMCVAEYSNRK